MRLVGLVGVGCFLILLPFLSKILIVILDYIDLQNPTDNRAFLNIATTLAFSPIAFLIWTFCDQNHLRQLDHQRKDINLKEFQKLSEWASGQHLPETKISRKTSKDTSKDTHEIHQAPTDKTELISRWDGAIALQISAIEQLEIYLHGEQGRAFQRPAFLLFKQLWGELIGPSDDTAMQHDNATSPLGHTLNCVLLQYQGRALREHAETLPSGDFRYLNSPLAGLEILDLHGLNLQGSQWYGAILSEADLRGANLRGIHWDTTTQWQAVIFDETTCIQRLKEELFTTIDKAITYRLNINKLLKIRNCWEDFPPLRAYLHSCCQLPPSKPLLPEAPREVVAYQEKWRALCVNITKTN